MPSYYIKADSRQYIVFRKRTTKGVTKDEPLTYHPTVDKALSSITNRTVRDLWPAEGIRATEANVIAELKRIKEVLVDTI